ncbi:MAG: putative nucleic acid-binding Zn-ribbon protein [Lentimonas sp.]
MSRVELSHLMADPQIEKLLIVQHRDVSLLKIEQDLARIPIERAMIESAIADEEANVEAARKSLIAKEVERKDLDLEVQSKETSLQRFRTQQVEVKKNDEYRALTHQIEQTEAEISSLEEREIGLMLDIDVAKEAFEAEKAVILIRIEVQRKEIALLTERVNHLSASVDAARAEVAASRVGVDTDYIEQYDRVKKMVKRAPYLAKIEAQKCAGCHLRVSNEVSRGAQDAGEPHFCDQCARMVYA